MPQLNQIHIILDIDGTLIDGDARTGEIKTRPGLQEFFEYCFTTFASVSIWTAANSYWMHYVRHRCFKDLIGGNEFKYTWSGERCGVRDGSLIKPLKKIWRRKYTMLTRYNTIIIDDTPETYQQNYGNAIGIPSYHKDAPDNLLWQLTRWMPQLIHQEVRAIDKRGWNSPARPL